jgi:hypothetical protein
MSTTLTAQTIAFICPSGSSISEAVIFADTGVQAAAALSQSQNILLSYQPLYNYTGVFIPQEALTLTFMVSAADALTIIADIAAMITRIATAAPQITDIQTWGTPCVFG